MVKLAECLNLQKDQAFTSFSKFFNLVMLNLSKEVTARKARMSSYHGCLGTISLMTNIPYVASNEDNCENLFKRKSFLRDHLYYLINPVDNRMSKFVSFPSQTEGKYLDVLAKSGTIVSWSPKKTYFKAEDFVSILLCLCIRFEFTISAWMKEAKNEYESNPNSVSSGQNTKALSLDPNSLEARAAVSLIHSSHIDSSSEANLIFDGRSGTVFMYNLVQNLIDDMKYKVSSGITLTFNCTLAEAFLSNVRIPFLLPYNFPSEAIPAILKNLNHNNIINCGNFTRTPNMDMIDGRFSFNYGNVLCTAAVECKNWDNVLNINDTINILEKAIFNNAVMSLIFCNSTVKFLNKESSALKTFCTDERIKLLRITRKPGTTEFAVVDMYPALEIKVPKLYSFILELNVINPN